MSEDGVAQLRVLIEAGYPALRAGLSAMLAYEADLLPFEDSGSSELLPDVIVIDAGTLSDNAFDDLCARFPDVPIIQIGAELEAADRAALSIPGGYLPADIDGPALAAAVRAVAQGLTVLAPGALASPEIVQTAEPSDLQILTPREREVLVLVAEGMPNKTIARHLGISEHTAKFHVGSVLGKLGASSRAEAVMIATRRGFLTV